MCLVVSRRKFGFVEFRGEHEQELLERRPSMPELSGFRNWLRREAEVTILPGMSR